MFLLLSSMVAAAEPSRKEVVDNGRYEPVTEPSSGQVVVDVALESRSEGCARTGGEWTWCVFPMLTIRNPSDQVLSIDANQISADWSADGSTRPLFAIDHEHDSTFAYPPIVLPPFGMWTSAMSRLNPNRWGKKLRFEEGQGLDRIYEPGNELTVTFPVEQDGERSWFSQRFVLRYDGPMIEDAEMSRFALLVQDPDYARVRRERNLSRVGWIIGASVGGATAFMANSQAQAEAAGTEGVFATGPVPLAAVSGVALTGAVLGFIIDRKKTRKLKDWPEPSTPEVAALTSP